MGKIPQKEMNHGREKVRKKISLRDLTSDQQEFQNKGTEETVGINDLRNSREPKNATYLPEKTERGPDNERKTAQEEAFL